MTVTFYTFYNYHAQFHSFLGEYNPVKVVLCGPTPPEEQQTLVHPRHRRCRFCGRDASEVKFNKTHLLSELLGNHYVLYDSECAECNLLFSRCESDLAAFLGIGRTMYGQKGKGKVPTFKSADRLVTARPGTWLGVEGIRLERPVSATGAFRIDDAQGTAEITVIKQPYVPYNVYLALLRMALSMVPAAEMAAYLPAIDQLLQHAPAAEFATYARIIQYTVPPRFRRSYPHCFLFERINPTTHQPRHHFYLAYQNLIFTFALPLHVADIFSGLYHEYLTVHSCPPLLAHPTEPDELALEDQLNLSSQVAIREQELIAFSHAPGAFGQSVAIDIATGEESPAIFNPSDVIGILLAPPGSSLTWPLQTNDDETPAAG